jgi:hypothetical protein
MTDPGMALKGPSSEAQGASPGTCNRMEPSPERAAQSACAALSGLCLSLQPIPGLAPWALLFRPCRASSFAQLTTALYRIPELSNFADPPAKPGVYLYAIKLLDCLGSRASRHRRSQRSSHLIYCISLIAVGKIVGTVVFNGWRVEAKRSAQNLRKEAGRVYFPNPEFYLHRIVAAG